MIHPEQLIGSAGFNYTVRRLTEYALANGISDPLDDSLAIEDLRTSEKKVDFGTPSIHIAGNTLPAEHPDSVKSKVIRTIPKLLYNMAEWNNDSFRNFIPWIIVSDLDADDRQSKEVRDILGCATNAFRDDSLVSEFHEDIFKDYLYTESPAYKLAQYTGRDKTGRARYKNSMSYSLVFPQAESGRHRRWQ